MNLFTRILAILLVFAVQSHGETELLRIIMGPSDAFIPPSGRRGSRLVTNFVEEDSLVSIVQQDAPRPPPVDQVAKMARYIVHYSQWTSLSHVSQQPQITNWPVSRDYSVSDGPISAGSGIPYLIMTPNDPEFVDLLKDPRASLTMSLAQTPYCRVKRYDPEDPRCAQVTLSGKFVVLKNSSSEWRTAERALYTRHPVMKNWPKSHNWVFCKLDIKRILVVDWFGGNKYPTVDEYFRASPDVCSKDNPMLEMGFY
uniref:CREG-like beta-barrel domain-containing protein n=1 Tax=Cuerna arida TaxID=1464854 RepID=A0A1B6GNH7_9HEMI